MNRFGKGFYIWKVADCTGGSPADIARRAVAAGLGHCLVKAADGPYAFNVIKGRDLAVETCAALKEAGIGAWVWQYVYGFDPIGEARQAAARITATGADGFVIDAEGEYKLPGRAKAAARYMSELRRLVGETFPIALSSYRFPSLHPELPLNEFLSRCSLVMPQVYWMGAHNPGAQLRRCVSEYAGIASLPVIPTGAACREGGWEPTISEMEEFWATAKELKLYGANWWSWSHAEKRSEWWQTIAAMGADGVTEPEPEPTEDGLKVRVLVDGLQVRTGPGVNFEPAGSLVAGSVLPVIDVSGTDVWIQFQTGRWCAVRRVGKVYAEVVR